MFLGQSLLLQGKFRVTSGESPAATTIIADNSHDALLPAATQVREQLLHAAAQHKSQVTAGSRASVLRVYFRAFPIKTRRLTVVVAVRAATAT